MDIEDEFDEYVINKVKTLMDSGKKWDIISSNTQDEWLLSQLPIEEKLEGKLHVHYTRQAKLGECFIIVVFYPEIENSLQIIAATYCGEAVSQKCMKEIEDLIKKYDKNETTSTRKERLRKIIDNNA